MGLAGDTVIAPPELAIPVPDRLTESGVALLLLVMFQAAESTPGVVGSNTMLALQLAEAASVDPHVVEATAKLLAVAPVMPGELRVTRPEVPFETEMVWDPLVAPSFTLPKGRLPGDTVTVPEPAIPVPDRATDSGVALLLLVMFQAAVSTPGVVGSNTMLAVQLADAARVDPHVVEAIAKLAAFAPEMLGELRLTELAVLFETVIV